MQPHRPTPSAPEVEQAVLGALLIDRSSWLLVPDLLTTPDVFHLEDHRRLYVVGLDLFSAGKPVDLITVIHGLRERGWLTDTLSPHYLSTLVAKVASTANVEYHCRILLELHIARKLIGLGSDLTTRLYDPRTDAFEALDRASTALTDLYGMALPSTMGTAADELIGLTDGSPAKYYTFGIPELDRMAVLQCGLPHVFAGRPGIGKSIFALEVCWHLTQVGRVLLFSPEMTKRQITARIVAREAGVPYSTILRGSMTEQEMALVVEHGHRIADRLARLVVDPTGGVTPEQVRIRTERELKKGGLVAFAVDHLHKMKTGDKRSDRDDFARVSQCMNGLTEAAKNTGLPALVMAQLNRGVETRADKRPNMADLRSSGEIEQDAAVVGLLYREGYYQPQPPASDTLEVNIAKNRDGAVGVASTTIEPPYSRIGGVLALPSMRAVRTGTDDAPF